MSKLGVSRGSLGRIFKEFMFWPLLHGQRFSSRLQPHAISLSRTVFPQAYHQPVLKIDPVGNVENLAFANSSQPVSLETTLEQLGLSTESFFLMQKHNCQLKDVTALDVRHVYSFLSSSPLFASSRVVRYLILKDPLLLTMDLSSASKNLDYLLSVVQLSPDDVLSLIKLVPHLLYKGDAIKTKLRTLRTCGFDDEQIANILKGSGQQFLSKFSPSSVHKKFKTIETYFKEDTPRVIGELPYLLTTRFNIIRVILAAFRTDWSLEQRIQFLQPRQKVLRELDLKPLLNAHQKFKRRNPHRALTSLEDLRPWVSDEVLEFIQDKMDQTFHPKLDLRGRKPGLQDSLASLKSEIPSFSTLEDCVESVST